MIKKLVAVSQAIRLAFKYTEGIIHSFCGDIVKIFFSVLELQKWAKERQLPICKETQAEFWE